MNTQALHAGGSRARAPHPLWLVARKELRDLVRDRRFLLLALLTLVLMVAALLLGALHADQRRHAHDAAAQGDARVWLAQGAKNPHAAAHFGQWAHKPMSPLALADPGVDAFVGSAIWLEAHRQNEGLFRAARDGTLAARGGALTLALLLQTLMPLLALLLGVAAWAGERDQGTLRPLLAQGVRPWQLMAGKALACAAVLLGLLLVASLALLLALSALGAPGGLEPARLGGAMLAYGAYLLGFLLLALALAAALPSTRTALVLLLGFWLVNCFVAPRWASDLVRASDPLPSAQALRSAINDAKRQQFGHDEKHPAYIALREATLRQYGVTRIEDLPVSFRGLALRADDEAGYGIFDQHFGRLQAQIEAQDQRRALGGFVFPLLALQPLSMAMAGTDNAHHHHFVRAAEAHRRRIQTLLSEDIIRNAPPAGGQYQAPAALWQQVPAFAYPRPPLAEAARGLGAPAAALALWLVLTAAAAGVAAARLRPSEGE